MKDTYNTIIIGSGCAGFNAADRLYSFGVRDIAIITEGVNMGTSRNTGSDKQTYYKLSLCGREGDSIREMAETLFSGGGVNGDIALTEAAYSVRAFMHLVELGVPFPTNEYGEYAGYKTDHDPRTRATSCGPLTSKYMTEALERSVRDKNIEILDGLRVIKILTDQGRVMGLAALDRKGKLSVFGCCNVILATGGPAGIYHNTVYPESQSGATGLAIDAGALCVNLEEWQYGIASTDFRWNLSGTYQQVLPRYISVGEDGKEVEFLYEKFGDSSLDLIFLKGYQWPFDTNKVGGSSQVDLAVAAEIRAGRRVFLDYTKNPRGLEKGFSVLSREAYRYLENSGALFGTPIERLRKMNSGAIDLYLSHGIDLSRERLAIAVCVQHCNGGVDVDSDWQSSVAGLFVAGEAAGTFGVCRPGGSALNSTQVGSLRAAEKIAREPGKAPAKAPEYRIRNFGNGEAEAREVLTLLRQKMSACADFDRDTVKMKALFAEVCKLCDDFYDIVRVRTDDDLRDAFDLYDTLLTQRAVLSAMLTSAEKVGSHGSAFVDRKAPVGSSSPCDTQTVTAKDESYLRPVRPMPDPELWFETLLARQKERFKAL